jgi:hypothetical protein
MSYVCFRIVSDALDLTISLGGGGASRVEAPLRGKTKSLFGVLFSKM